MLFSPSLRTAGKVSINVLTNLFGVQANIYYPRGFDSARAGLDAEVQYDDEPNIQEKLLAPFLFSNSQAHYGGFYDELSGDDKFIYDDNTHDYPRFTLIVFDMDGGESSYIVDSTEANNDEYGKIYSKVRLKSFNRTSFSKTPKKIEKSIEVMQYLTDEDIDENNSVSEFLDDLLGENNKERDEVLEELEEMQTEPEYNPKIDNRVVHKRVNKMYSEMELV